MTYPTGWDGPGYYAAQLGPEQVRTDWTAPIGEPGIVPPRPLQLGDILGGAFRSVRFAPLTMFGLSLVVLMVAQLFGLGIGYVTARQFGAVVVPFEDEGLGDTTLLSWTTIASALANSVTEVVLGMGLMYTVHAAAFGRKVSPRSALRHLLSRTWPALGLSALLGLGGAALTAPLIGIVVLAVSDADGRLALLLLLLPVSAVAGVWLVVRLLFAPCAIAIEGVGPIRAIQRSWALSRGQFWRLLGIWGLSSIIISMAAGTVSSVFSFAGLLLGVGDANLALLATTTASTLTSSVLSLPLSNAVVTLLYVDSRIRGEGYDLQLGEALYG